MRLAHHPALLRIPAAGALFAGIVCGTLPAVTDGGSIARAVVAAALISAAGSLLFGRRMATVFAVGALLIFHKNILDLFESLIVSGFNDSARFATWKACWERFTEYPVFGVGFYKTPGTMMTESGMYTEFVEGTPDGVFLALRSHNTLFQLLATGGTFAVVGYAVHRIQTLVLCFRRPSVEKAVAAMCVASLLLTSLLDCHMFNMGPGLMYSVLLVFAEKQDGETASVLQKKTE